MTQPRSTRRLASLLTLGLSTALLAPLWVSSPVRAQSDNESSITDVMADETTDTAVEEASTWQQPTIANWQPEGGDWEPIPSQRRDYGKIKVVWLTGTPYEMGYQHGDLLRDEIASMGQEVISSLNFFGRALALGRLSRHRSFPGVYEECQGLADATADIGMTVEGCMVLALGDVYQEYFGYFLPGVLFYDGCAHFIAGREASADGRFYHGWTLDNGGGPLPYWADNPTILVRQPDNGIPHVFITVPGMSWPNGGFNAEGVIISNNTSHPATFDDLDLDGRSTVQLMSQVTQFARNYEEAFAIIDSHNRMRSNLLIVSDAQSDRAAVFEMLGEDMGVREMDDNGLLYMTNHFAAPEFVGRDTGGVDPSSLNRFLSFQQQLEPDGERTRYGTITPEVAVEILRDRTNPNTFEPSPMDVKDDDASIGGNGSHRQVVFDPTGLRFWMTNSEVEQPVPESPFVCFSMDTLLGLPNADPCPAPMIE